MARRHRSVRTLRELQEEAAAAEALGLNEKKPERRPAERAPREPRTAEPAKSRPKNQPRVRVVWAVCDIGGREIATYEYARKADAEAHAAQLEARGKGTHFVRSVKQPLTTD